jgi:hypothetical protein
MWCGTPAFCAAALAAGLPLVGLTAQEATTDGIPVQVTLPNDALVTLVLEDTAGHHVRDFVAEQPCMAGENRLVWDGLDNAGRIVPPGRYRYRGLYRDPLHLAYQFSVYNAGASLPWFHPNVQKPSDTGWLSDHNPLLQPMRETDVQKVLD